MDIRPVARRGPSYIELILKLELAGHGADDNGAFRPIKNITGSGLNNAITADGIYRIVRGYSSELGFTIGAHSLRATAATNALLTYQASGFVVIVE